MDLRRTVLVGLLATLCACSSSSSTSSTAPSTTSSPLATYTLSGIVLEFEPNRPIASATVNVSGTTTRTATTDAAGRFSIAGVPEGAISITVSAPGYLTFIRAVNLSAQTASQTFFLGTATACPALGFDDLTVENATVTTSSMCGLTLTTTLGGWFVSNYGHPVPAIHFQASGGGPTQGEVLVSAGGRRFRFLSVDLYSSVTTIPYAFTGILGSATVFTVTNTQPSTSGAFATVTNPQSSVFVDSLVIRLTNNPGVVVPDNPMGIDNIRVSF